MTTAVKRNCLVAFLCGIVMALSGCAASGVVSLNQAEQGGRGTVSEVADLLFYDGSSFDNDLAQNLAMGPDRATVRAAAVTINDLPERLGKWLAAVRERGGEVEFKGCGETTTRGLVGELIDVSMFAAAMMHEKITYSTVVGYDAVVNYEQASGRIRHIDFVKREDSP